VTTSRFGLANFAAVGLMLATCMLPLFGQQTTATNTVVPMMVNFSGMLTDPSGKPLSTITGVTFSLYAEQQGGAPLWLETQNVRPDKTGHYTVQLGSATGQGLPANLFTSGQARWLGVQAQGQEQEPRIMLLSVPYALKAGDAQTLGGKPASAFMTVPNASAGPGTGSSGLSAQGASLTLTGIGKKDYVPLWLGSSKLGNSRLFQSIAGYVGIGTTSPGATLDVSGTVNAATSYNLAGNAFAFGSYASQNAFLGFAGNATATGPENTAIGYQALAANTTGQQNTATGYQALLSNTTGIQNTAVGESALLSNTTGGGNVAIGIAALSANTTGSGNIAVGTGLSFNTTGSNNTVIGFGMYSNTTGSANTAVGEYTIGSDAGNYNTANGYLALYSNPCNASYNTAVGYAAGYTSYSYVQCGQGNYNTFVGSNTMAKDLRLNNVTAIGANAQVTASNSMVLGSINGVNGATASTNIGIGTTAPTYLLHIGSTGGTANNNFLRVEGPSTSNSGGMAASFGGSGDFGIDAVGTAEGRFVVKENGTVGIHTAKPSNVLTIGQGAGHAIADGWDTYSSRRWKTNIRTLHGALAKVEQLRGVSYDLKDSGKHEVGVIAEEVGAVVPEVVTFENDGKDARGVDYTRLIALLIESTKEQQSLIRKQQQQMAHLNSEVKAIIISLKSGGRAVADVRSAKAQVFLARQ
jgi:Chaperone of endosialidase